MHFPRHVLLNTIKKELRYEKSFDKNIVYLSEFVRKHGLFQKTSENSTKVNLYKQIPPYKLQVEFSQRFPKKIKKKEDDDEEEETTKILENGENNDLSIFYISIQKNIEENMHLECFTIDSQIMINHIVFTKTMPNEISPLFLKVNGQVNFNTLNENLQGLIVEWLKTVGLTDDLGKFVEMNSLHKEREMYKNWLKGVCESLEEKSENS